MKVLIGRRIEPKQGIDTYVQFLIDGIKNLKKIKIYEYKTNISAEFSKKSFQNKTISFFKKIYRDQIALPEYIKRNGMDIFHCTENYGIPIYLPCKAVTTIHDLIPLKFKIWNKLQRYRFLKQMEYAVNKSEKIITVSENSKKDIVNMLNLKSENVFVTYLTVDKTFKVERKQEKIERVKEKFSIKKPYIMIVGGVNPRKNTKRIIDIFMRNYREKYQLVVVGENFIRMNYDTTARYDKNIIFTGFIDKVDLILLYNGAELFVYPSIYEGFGIPILESMACGTPVVTSNISSMPEVAGDAALLIDPYDSYSINNAMNKILNDKILQNELVFRGFERIKKFPFEKLAKETSEIYSCIM